MKAQRGGFLTGLVVGLLIGLGVALGVALYITKAPVPFINKLPQRGAEQDAAEAERNKHWDPNAPLAGKNPARPAANATTPSEGGATAASPDAGNPGSPATPPADATAPHPAVATSPATTATTATAAAVPASTSAGVAASAARAARESRDPAAILAAQPAAAGPGAGAAPASRAAGAVQASFFVQAGAYARSEDAEAQRAKLALMGLAARVTEREQSGRTVYRVRLGPFDSRDAAEDTQGQLGGAGIETNLVRVER